MEKKQAEQIAKSRWEGEGGSVPEPDALPTVSGDDDTESDD